MSIKPNCIYFDGFVTCNNPKRMSKFLFLKYNNPCVLFSHKLSCPDRIEKVKKPNVSPVGWGKKK